MRNNDLILCYHSIGSGATKHGELNINPAASLELQRFIDQITWLKKNVNLVPLAELISSPELSHNQRVAITFDDGYRDNLTNALPVLKKLKIPFTWFIATKYVEEESYIPWWDMSKHIERYFQEKITLEILDKPYFYDLEQLKEKERFSVDIRTLCMYNSILKREQVENSLMALIKTKLKSPKNSFARHEEILKAYRQNSEIMNLGVHTHRHLNLFQESDETIIKDINDNLTRLRHITNESMGVAYPYGQRDKYSQSTKKIARKMNLDWAVTTNKAYLTRKTDQYEIPRLTITPNTDIRRFKYQIRHLNLFNALVKFKKGINAIHNIKA